MEEVSHLSRNMVLTEVQTHKNVQHGLTLLLHQDALPEDLLRASLTRVQLGEKAEHICC